NPYDADTLAQTGFFRAMRGDGEAGLALLDKAVQLNPMHPTWYYYDRGEALLAVGRYQEGIFCAWPACRVSRRSPCRSVPS
ncbi:tetratricopeptide repeat protein, partial [Mesorhizobium sp. M2D.F.Ca.ET.140.01.1.1]|uniref:tetratricopeptide repeat protein n=1 Tax=Mesorhizobium sp. M2D.F.Ca.ET.140.01.1.1 TaxID=2496664 RepID=UPI0016761EA5